MNTQANIHFINFDSVSEEENHCQLATDLVGMEINNFLLDRFESEYDLQCGNFIFTPKTQPSYLNDQQELKSIYLSDTSLIEQSRKLIDESEEKSKESSGKENSHKDAKNFCCEYDNCLKTFKFKWILDRHYLSHKPTKLFKCSYENCCKSYKSKENLTLHIKNIHLKEKPYSCRYCCSVFSHRNGKTYHERKFHTNYLPHKCDILSKFNQINNLDCGLTFASKSALTYHLKSQHSSSDDASSKSHKRRRTRFNQEILRFVNEDTFSPNNYGQIKDLTIL